MKQRQQVPDRLGISREIDAARVSTVLHDGLTESFVLFEPDDSHGMTILQKRLAQLKIVLERPGAYWQEAAAGIDQHQRLALHRRVIWVQGCDGPLQLL